jgi:hypothetical protein
MEKKKDITGCERGAAVHLTGAAFLETAVRTLLILDRIDGTSLRISVNNDDLRGAVGIQFTDMQNDVADVLCLVQYGNDERDCGQAVRHALMSPSPMPSIAS